MGADTLTIAESPIAIHSVFAAGRLGSGTPFDGNSFYWRALSVVQDATIWKITAEVPRNYQTHLTYVKRARVYFPPLFHHLACVVFGNTPNPKIGEPGNVHLMPDYAMHWPQFDTASANDTLNYNYTARNHEVELPPDFRYFSLWLYDYISVGTDPSGLALPIAPNGTPVSPALIGYVNGSVGLNQAFVIVTFYGR